MTHFMNSLHVLFDHKEIRTRFGECTLIDWGHGQDFLVLETPIQKLKHKIIHGFVTNMSVI